MTEILINELSLDAQFTSLEGFICDGPLKDFNARLNELKSFDVLVYKKNDFFDYKIINDKSIYDILVGSISRQYDEIRKMKSNLVFLFEDPYWESNQKHSENIYYSYDDKCITGQSLAEACERDKIVISFSHNNYLKSQLAVYKEKEEIIIGNICKEKSFFDIAFNRNLIDFESFCKYKFKGEKIDFSMADKKQGFSIITKEDEKLFFDAFRKFTALSWTQIIVDDGLDYKEYNDSEGYFKAYKTKIHKFRVSQKYRCFGYTEQGIFHVLLFDLTHKMSD